MKILAVGCMLGLAMLAQAQATPALEARCHEYVNAVVPHLPVVQDEITSATGITCVSDILTVDMTVHDIPAGKYIDWSRGKSIVVKAVCEQPIGWMQDGLTANYRYYDTSGTFLYSFSFNKTDCPNS